MKKRTAGLTALLMTLACQGNPTGPDNAPVLPTAWAPAVSNQYFPLVPGTTFEFAGQTANGPETVTVAVLRETKTINGVVATVVRDRVFLNGALKEDTIDWYAQDNLGNVWYLGEAVKDYQNGQVVSTEGSFQWGVDGALPGIIMWADPLGHAGVEYRQEYYKGHAEDYAKVLAGGQAVAVPAGSYSGCIKIEEWNALKNEPHTSKFYCPQVGIALETSAVSGGDRVELVRITRP